MATIEQEQAPRIDPAVQGVLNRLRVRIRRYVWLEGLAALVVWLGLAFWLSLAIDWLLEPPAAVRVVLLGAVVIVLGVIFVRLIGRRAFVPLPDSSMATVLERRFPKIDDSLLTAVVLSRRRAEEAGYDPVMLARTCREATERVAGLRVPEVFDPLPLRRKMAAALGLIVTITLFAAALPEAFHIWARRSLGMSGELWPRSIRLEVDETVFKDGVARVAKGNDLDVVVRALQGDTEVPVVPQAVQVRYKIEGGQRGRQLMNRLGERRETGDVLQEYSHTFRGILAPITFDVAGGDARLDGLHIEVVENPVLLDKETELEEEFPAYMHRGKRRVTLSGAEKAPIGTLVTLHARANKELDRVRIEVPAEDKLSARLEVLEGDRLSSDRRGFSFALGPLRRDTTLYVSLLDTDGINSRDPIRVPIAAIADEPPQVGVRLAGIGSAITPKARMPVAGRITDDYGIGEAWYEYAVNQEKTVTRPLVKLDKHPADYPLPETVLPAGELNLSPGQKLLLSVKAADLCTLNKGPNVGTSDRWLLDVVTPDQLRAMLEARQLVLRQRFEAIIYEVQETHDLLARMSFGEASAKPGGKPSGKPSALRDGSEPGEEDAPKENLSPAEQLARRTERVRQARENSSKNAHETLGVAEAFDDIRQQYVNNGIDAEDQEAIKRLGASVAGLKDRLGGGIIDPLNMIVHQSFPELDKRLERLQAALDDSTLGPERRESARRQVLDILVAMRTVLDRMMKLEEYGELVSRLRNIIDLQEKINELTKKKHKEGIRGLLEE